MPRYRAWWRLDNGGLIEAGTRGESPEAMKRFLKENFPKAKGYLKIYEWGWGKKKKLVYEGEFPEIESDG